VLIVISAVDVPLNKGIDYEKRIIGVLYSGDRHIFLFSGVLHAIQDSGKTAGYRKRHTFRH
jgi:hypothetical protein